VLVRSWGGGCCGRGGGGRAGAVKARPAAAPNTPRTQPRRRRQDRLRAAAAAGAHKKKSAAAARRRRGGALVFQECVTQKNILQLLRDRLHNAGPVLDRHLTLTHVHRETIVLYWAHTSPRALLLCCLHAMVDEVLAEKERRPHTKGYDDRLARLAAGHLRMAVPEEEPVGAGVDRYLRVVFQSNDERH